jgi:hypothetical protein
LRPGPAGQKPHLPSERATAPHPPWGVRPAAEPRCRDRGLLSPLRDADLQADTKANSGRFRASAIGEVIQPSRSWCVTGALTRGAESPVRAVVAVPPDNDTGGPSASTTAYRSRVVESECLPPRTAQAAKARSNATVGFALSLLGSLVRSPQSRNQWWLWPQPVALSVGRSPTENERPPQTLMHQRPVLRAPGHRNLQEVLWAEPGIARTMPLDSICEASR